MRPRGQFKLIPYRNRSGSASWRVSGTSRDGLRIQRNFQSLDAAKVFLAEQTVEAINRDADYSMRRTLLSPAQISEAELAFRNLKSGTLADAVKLWNETSAAASRSISVGDAFKLFMESKQRSNRRPATIRNLNDRVGRLAEFLAGKTVAEITAADLSQFIFQPTLSDRTKANNRQAAVTFMKWCRVQGYCSMIADH